MNIEFHYYTIYYLAVKSGFSHENAHVMAYSSQYVDSNIISYTISTHRETVKTEPTQNYGFWEENCPTDIYLPFHFCPGDVDHPGGERIDGKRNPYNTTPNSKNAKKILVTALKTGNLYRIGIALHTFADSWAHQNFSGILEEWNIFDSNSVVPHIGHAQALKAPDIVTNVWRDPRLTGDDQAVSNKVRYLEAAKKIYRYLCLYNRRDYADEFMIQDTLARIYSSKSAEARINDFIIECDMHNYDRMEWLSQAAYVKNKTEDESLFTGYDKLLWVRDTLLYKTQIVDKNTLTGRDEFYQTHYYKWHKAAGDHKREAQRVLSYLPVYS